MKRVLLITGASSGIGASLVRRFAADYDEIVAAARRVDRMRDAFADLSNVTPARLDVSDPDELTAFARQLVARHGVVPYVVSCAGAWNPKPLLEASNDDLAHGWRIDALAHAILLRELVPAMRDHDFGRFVVFSGSATLVPMGGWSIQYGAIMACNGCTVAAAIETATATSRSTSPHPARPIPRCTRGRCLRAPAIRRSRGCSTWTRPVRRDGSSGWARRSPCSPASATTTRTRARSMRSIRRRWSGSSGTRSGVARAEQIEG